MKLPKGIHQALLRRLSPETHKRLKVAEDRVAELEAWRREMHGEIHKIIRAVDWNDSLPTAEELSRSKEYQLRRVLNHFYAVTGNLRVVAWRLEERLRKLGGQ